MEEMVKEFMSCNSFQVYVYYESSKWVREAECGDYLAAWEMAKELSNNRKVKIVKQTVGRYIMWEN